MNFGVVSLAAPKAASSRVARYSFTARLAVSGSHVFCHSAPGIERCLLGISLDQARIHGKPFAANEAGCDTSLDHTLEYLTKDAAVAEALIASTRERRMIRDFVLDAELAKPAIGKVHLYLTTQQPLGSQPKNIADDQHPDHQHRINRGPAERGIVRR